MKPGLLILLCLLGLSQPGLADPARRNTAYKLNFNGFVCPVLQKDSVVKDTLLPQLGRLAGSNAIKRTNEINIVLVIIDAQGHESVVNLPRRGKAYKVTKGQRIHLNKTLWRGQALPLDFQIIAWEVDDPKLANKLTGLAVDFALTQGRGRVAKSMVRSRMAQRAASGAMGQVMGALDISSQISRAISPITRRVTGADNDLIGGYNAPTLYPDNRSQRHRRNGFNYTHYIGLRGSGVSCEFYFDFMPEPERDQAPASDDNPPNQAQYMWGAIAMDAERRDLYYYDRQPTPFAAEHGALSYCRDKSSNRYSCKIIASYDHCASEAIDSTEAIRSIAQGNSPDEARHNAVSDCENSSHRQCLPDWTFCSDGLRQTHELHFAQTEPPAPAPAPPVTGHTAQREQPAAPNTTAPSQPRKPAHLFLSTGPVKASHKQTHYDPGPWAAMVVAKQPQATKPAHIFYINNIATAKLAKQAVWENCLQNTNDDQSAYDGYQCRVSVAFDKCAVAVKNYNLSDAIPNIAIAKGDSVQTAEAAAMKSCEKLDSNQAQGCRLMWSRCNYTSK